MKSQYRCTYSVLWMLGRCFFVTNKRHELVFYFEIGLLLPVLLLWRSVSSLTQLPPGRRCLQQPKRPAASTRDLLITCTVAAPPARGERSYRRPRGQWRVFMSVKVVFMEDVTRCWWSLSEVRTKRKKMPNFPDRTIGIHLSSPWITFDPRRSLLPDADKSAFCSFIF